MCRPFQFELTVLLDPSLCDWVLIGDFLRGGMPRHACCGDGAKGEQVFPACLELACEFFVVSMRPGVVLLGTCDWLKGRRQRVAAIGVPVF